MRKRTILFVVIGMLSLMTACDMKGQEAVSLNSEELTEDVIETEKTIFVYVCGAVVNEGVYELPIGSRVYEAIEKAGGFLTNAAVTEINQAQILEDAMKLYIPTKEELAQLQLSGKGKVNLNRASKEELMTLPGIGESKADSIIAYRKEKGSFKNIKDIMQIAGIKESLYQKIKDLIQV